ncbi:hypothetical protein Sjap_011127 [Stephania japonica]|uniref:PX domain-containing protein n=1 Tax=Stephania japonica TaxID=461633 RepID=A0AAP0JBT8_9MAGN
MDGPHKQVGDPKFNSQQTQIFVCIIWSSLQIPRQDGGLLITTCSLSVSCPYVTVLAPSVQICCVDGRDSIWPHDPRTGWSYCVTIPSWIIRPKLGDSEGVAFYKVQVGIQSPEGITSVRGVLRRFSDFMKLLDHLKRTFPRKHLPPAPSKHVLRINSNKSLPEERRFTLEEWMGKLLSDIDVSRSVPVASFLELEAAARSSFHDVDSAAFDVKPTGNNMVLGQASSNISVVDGSSSITPDYGSDACETSEIGTPGQGRYNSSEVGTEDITVDQELTTPIENLVKYGMSNIENGLFMEDSILEHIEGFPRHKFHAKTEIGSSGREKYNGNTSRTRNALHTNSKEHFSGPEHGNLYGHSRKLSNESVGSDISSIRGSEASITGLANSVGDGCLDSTGDFEAPSTLSNIGNMDLHFPDNVQVLLPMEHRSKLNRVLTTLQQRLATAKTDMEDLFTRLNQEIAVKEYLTTKVKDLEVELETTKQKSKENLQQAILSERERFTQMQWDMEELRRKSLEMESKLKAEQDSKFQTESTKTFALRDKELLVQEFDSTQEKLANLQSLHEELLVKSKAETKILVKEIKSLRTSQSELKQELALSQKHKSEIERVLQEEKERTEKEKNGRRRLLHECVILRHRLQECSVNLLSEEIDKLTADSSSLSDALDLLTTSDNRIGLLLAEAQLLAQDDENATVTSSGRYDVNGIDLTKLDIEIRKMLSDIFIDNATLRKQVNSAIRFALQTNSKSDKESNEETPSRKIVLNKFLER